MADPQKPPRQLNTWPEIASYLGVGIRAAQKYERQHGLPIHRLPGEKSRVWAYPAELDAWKKRPLEKGAEPVPIPIPTPPEESNRSLTAAIHPSRSVPRLVIGVLAAVLFSAGLLASYRYLKASVHPAGIKVQGSSLIVADRSDHELWRHSFSDGLQKPSYEGPDVRKVWAVGDINNDGRPELLFVYYPANWQSVGASVICFSDRGKLKWQFVPGKPVRSPVQSFRPPFFISNVQIIPKSSRQAPQIAVIANHHLRYPNQLALLDQNGQLLAEYWHSGHLLSMVQADLDKDGAVELLLGGLNNGHRSAMMIVLNPDDLSGAFAQPEGDSTQLLGFQPGTEKAAVLFPRTCLAQDAEFNRIVEVRIAGDRIVAVVAEGPAPEDHPGQLVYELDLDLSVVNVILSPKFKESHRRAE